VYGRFQLEILREDGRWAAYRLEPGKRIRLPELAIPGDLDATQVAQFLDDLYHEMSKPGQAIRVLPDPQHIAAQDGVGFRPLCEPDLAMLHEWIHRPHVMEWWGAEAGCATLDETRSKYLPRLVEESHVRPHIALLSGEPIGFIQSYVAVACGGGWWEDETDAGVRGIDQFLADGTKLGQGLGTRMVSAFVRRLFEDREVTRIQTDPSPSNARAIRCYEKVGFRALREVTTPAGPALLMVIDRAEAARG